MIDCKIDLSQYKGKLREAISAAIQKYAFERGVAWRRGEKNVKHTEHCVLMIHDNAMGFGRDSMYAMRYHLEKAPEVSAEDFLEGRFPVPEVTVKAFVVNQPYQEFKLKDGESVTVHNVGGKSVTAVEQYASLKPFPFWPAGCTW